MYFRSRRFILYFDRKLSKTGLEYHSSNIFEWNQKNLDLENRAYCRVDQKSKSIENWTRISFFQYFWVESKKCWFGKSSFSGGWWKIEKHRQLDSNIIFPIFLNEIQQKFDFKISGGGQSFSFRDLITNTLGLKDPLRSVEFLWRRLPVTQPSIDLEIWKFQWKSSYDLPLGTFGSRIIFSLY